MSETVRKVVAGLRLEAARGRECLLGLVEAKPIADALDGFATELEKDINPPTASADLLAARDVAATIFERYTCPIRSDGRVYASGRVAAQAIRDGDFDDLAVVQDLLIAVERGRELAAEDHRKQRLADMMAAPAKYVTPKRLTITVDGPQRSGKTTLCEWLWQHGRFVDHWITEKLEVGLLPDIIEIRDGRRFDVRNDVFLDGER